VKTKTAGVIGGGVMGSGIAQALATAGIETRCFDPDPAAIERAKESVRSGRYGVERGVERGKISATVAELTLARLTFVSELAEAVEVDIVVECVPERLDLKITTFRELDRLAPADTILASNTSGFPICALAAATDRPDRVLGWHWASPPVVMRFAEIVRAPATAEASIEQVRELAAACGKNPIVVNDNPMVWGFVANRIYGAMLREAAQVVAEGTSTQEDVNQLMVDCFNWPVGPYGMIKGATKGWK
jgi:3-hydroxybutyryl-CoA dehydrogenase